MASLLAFGLIISLFLYNSSASQPYSLLPESGSRRFIQCFGN